MVFGFGVEGLKTSCLGFRVRLKGLLLNPGPETLGESCQLKSRGSVMFMTHDVAAGVLAAALLLARRIQLV